ncbi:spexin prohormone 2 [Lepisosteus oculatus]|uniref:spexin prohormone 2 n=1 Tax=Lepisosteus oculatus TaxID=7918 RepID=UPI0035F5281F
MEEQTNFVQLVSQNKLTANPDVDCSQTNQCQKNQEIVFKEGTYSIAKQASSDIYVDSTSSKQSASLSSCGAGASVCARLGSGRETEAVGVSYGFHSARQPDCQPASSLLRLPPYSQTTSSQCHPTVVSRLGTGTNPRSRGTWSADEASQFGAMSAEVMEAVASITSDSTEEASYDVQLYEKFFPQQEMTAVQRSLGIVDNQPMLTQPVPSILKPFDHPREQGHSLCQGGPQLVVVNSCNQGQMNSFHGVEHSHTIPYPEPQAHTPFLTDTAGKAVSAPLGRVATNAVQTPCLNIPQKHSSDVPLVRMGPPFTQPLLFGAGHPVPRPPQEFLHPSCMVPPPVNSGFGYNFLPTSYFPQACPFFSNTVGFLADTCTQGQSERSLIGFAGASWDSKSKKPCNCTKSQCLKMYCDCFANGEICSNCNCINCYNNVEHESERYKAIKTCLDRNPEAFRPKIGNGKHGEIKGRHNKGCNCKRSGCLKNYCECYEAKIMCSTTCKCVGCKNYKDCPEQKMMGSTDFGEKINTRPYKISTDIIKRCPLSCVTLDVVQATCRCLLVRAEEAEKAVYSLYQAEKMILEEFGQCLTQIIQSMLKSGNFNP